jgi:mannose-6-phosphate isomerase-like protein (cupin superfamily)
LTTSGGSSDADGVSESAPRRATCTVIRASEAVRFLEGAEECHEYVRRPEFWIGTSRLPPGAEGDVDPGHADHVEVFLVAAGSVSIFTGDTRYRLETGDALFIPPTIPHTLRNEGAEDALLVWAAGLEHGG